MGLPDHDGSQAANLTIHTYPWVTTDARDLLEDRDRLKRELAEARADIEKVYQDQELAIATRKKAEQEHDRRREAVIQAHHAHCSCGGSGPKDPGACAACRMWHEIQALAGGEGK